MDQKAFISAKKQLQSSSPIIGGFLQHSCSDCRKKHQFLQRRAVRQAGPEIAPPIVHEVLRSPGQSLDAETRGFMEPRFSHDFSGVRIHTDGGAAQSAKDVNALAYSIGQDIVFNAGQYRPNTLEGKRLLAHELTHVIQQGFAPFRREQLRSSDNIENEGNSIPNRISYRLTHASPSKIQRATASGCVAPSEMPTISTSDASQFGEIVEIAIEADYCAKMSCALMVTDYIDNPIVASYIAFLAANNPHLTAVDIATIAVLSQISLSRPDILTHKPGRKEFEEIKPNSISGRAAGSLKVGSLIGFYGIWSLPYVPGATWVPSPEILLATAPGCVEVFLRLQRHSAGLVVYDICIRGPEEILTLYAIIAIILAVIAIILSRGRILRGSPIPLPSPLLAGQASGEGGGERLASNNRDIPSSTLQTKLMVGDPKDTLEQEADTIAMLVMKSSKTKPFSA